MRGRLRSIYNHAEYLSERHQMMTPHDREDLFQEIATQVWRSIPSFRGESAVGISAIRARRL